MKAVYPAVFTPTNSGYVVYVPDFSCNTQGKDLTEAIRMARDVIGIMGIDMQDEKQPLPTPSSIYEVPHNESDIVSLVDIDFTEYRKKSDTHTVRRNVSLPAWLNAEADIAGINVSAVLQNALKEELKL